MPAPSNKKSSAKKIKAKVISLHSEENVIDEKQTILQQAATAEKNEHLALAEKLYKKQMQLKAFNAFVYTRLMIIYRKQKRYKEELEIINKGIKHFTEHKAKQSAKRSGNAVIKKISNSLNKSLGLTDNKGNFLFDPEPVATWKKRKITVEKKWS